MQFFHTDIYSKLKTTHTHILLNWPHYIFYPLNLPLTENLFVLLHLQINIIYYFYFYFFYIGPHNVA